MIELLPMAQAFHKQESSLAVSEIFGPTFQGEGASLGRRCAFLRLGGCNLACSWCDTPYTWDWTGKNGTAYRPSEQIALLSPSEVWTRLLATGAHMLVVSGGEPMLQARQLTPVLAGLRARGWWTEVETNGTIRPPDSFDAALFDRYTVSPKLASSGNGPERIVPHALAWYRDTGRATWKFVATSPDDLDEIAELVDRYDLSPVYIMPEGRSAPAVLAGLRSLADPVLARGWNLTPRLHTLLWGDDRGR